MGVVRFLATTAVFSFSTHNNSFLVPCTEEITHGLEGATLSLVIDASLAESRHLLDGAS